MSDLKDCKYYERGACLLRIENHTWKCRDCLNPHDKIPCQDFTPKDKKDYI